MGTKLGSVHSPSQNVYVTTTDDCSKIKDYQTCTNAYPTPPADLLKWVGGANIFMIKGTGITVKYSIENTKEDGTCKDGHKKCEGKTKGGANSYCVPASFNKCPVREVSDNLLPDSEKVDFGQFSLYL